jgi:hypothetical protein
MGGAKLFGDFQIIAALQQHLGNLFLASREFIPNYFLLAQNPKEVGRS